MSNSYDFFDTDQVAPIISTLQGASVLNLEMAMCGETAEKRDLFISKIRAAQKDLDLILGELTDADTKGFAYNVGDDVLVCCIETMVSGQVLSRERLDRGIIVDGKVVDSTAAEYHVLRASGKVASPPKLLHRYHVFIPAIGDCVALLQEKLIEYNNGSYVDGQKVGHDE